MNKTDLIDTLAEKTDHTKTDISRMLDALLDTIAATVARGDKLQLVGFGTFEPKHRPARTGESFQIAETTVPRFTPGKVFKERVVEAHKAKSSQAGKKKEPNPRKRGGESAKAV